VNKICAGLTHNMMLSYRHVELSEDEDITAETSTNLNI